MNEAQWCGVLRNPAQWLHQGIYQLRQSSSSAFKLPPIYTLYLFLQKRTKTPEEIDIYYLRLPVLLEDEWECFPANLSSTMVAAAAPPGHVCWHVMPRPHVRCRGATCPDVRTMVVMTVDLFDDH